MTKEQIVKVISDAWDEKDKATSLEAISLRKRINDLEGLIEDKQRVCNNYHDWWRSSQCLSQERVKWIVSGWLLAVILAVTTLFRAFKEH